MIKKLLNQYPLLILLLVYLVFTLFTYKDYGITADEELEYRLGENLQQFFVNKPEYHNNDLLENKPYLKYYYHFYPMILSIVNIKGYYEWYHLLNMLFASIILISAYYLFYTEYKNKFLALIAPILILLTPSFVGSIPANPKDIPFAIMYFLSIALLYVFNKNSTHSWWKIIILGLTFGFTQSLRIVGYSLYLIYILDLVINKREKVKDKVAELVVIGGIAHLVMFLTWPYVRESIFNLLNLFLLSKDFTPWDRSILYMGETITREQIPWTYLLTYILITTPVFITIMHFLSFKFLKTNGLLKILMISIYINVVAYLIMRPVIYNGMRHFLYLIPLLVSTVAIFIVGTIQKKKNLVYLYIGVAIMLLVQITQWYPYHYSYFNPIIRNTIIVEDKFETDYWGASYKAATEKLIEHLDANNIKGATVYACNVDYAVRYYSKYKFEMVNTRSKANFIICDYENDREMHNTDKIIGVISKNNIIFNIIRETKIPINL